MDIIANVNNKQLFLILYNMFLYYILYINYILL